MLYFKVTVYNKPFCFMHQWGYLPTLCLASNYLTQDCKIILSYRLDGIVIQTVLKTLKTQARCIKLLWPK